jgi:hypothetical protein
MCQPTLSSRRRGLLYRKSVGISKGLCQPTRCSHRRGLLCRKSVGTRDYQSYAVNTASVCSGHVCYDNFSEKSLVQLTVDKNTMSASKDGTIMHIAMPQSLLSIPPELLVHILAFLPIQSLLKFSQTSRYAHSLASSSLHTLSLGIHPSRVAALIARVAATEYPQPKEITSFFSLPHHAPPSEQRNSSENFYVAEEPLTLDNSYKVSVLIPDAQIFDYTTLLNFHTALTSSVLFRHGATLRHLDLFLWTLTIPIAKALSGLSALRGLSIRVEDFPQVRAVPRTRAASQRTEEREAWSLLTETAMWVPRLNALRIEGGELNTAQLATLLGKVRWCRELWLCKCAMIDRSVWKFLASEWEGRSAVQILGISRCGGKLDEEVLDWIGGFKSLRVSSPVP